MHRHVSLIVDIRHARCGACKVAVRNELATRCLSCGSVFERIQSNHAGLALKFERRRAAAGVFEPKAAVALDESEPRGNSTRADSTQPVSNAVPVGHTSSASVSAGSVHHTATAVA